MKLEAIVLAAGASTRFGSDKLRAIYHGEPLLCHAIRAARAAPVVRVVVVAPPEIDIGSWPALPPVHHLPTRSDALSSSLKAGIEACGDADGVFVFLGDMPLVPHGVASRLADALGGHIAAQPWHDGKPGHPVLIRRAAFSLLADLRGDQGAGVLLRSREDVVRLDADEPGTTLDIDRPDDLGKLPSAS